MTQVGSVRYGIQEYLWGGGGNEVRRWGAGQAQAPFAGWGGGRKGRDPLATPMKQATPFSPLAWISFSCASWPGRCDWVYSWPGGKERPASGVPWSGAAVGHRHTGIGRQSRARQSRGAGSSPPLATRSQSGMMKRISRIAQQDTSNRTRTLSKSHELRKTSNAKNTRHCEGLRVVVPKVCYLHTRKSKKDQFLNLFYSERL